MTGQPLPVGKLGSDILAGLLAGLPTPAEVLLGPAVGEDAGAIDMAGGGTLIVATDPITLTGQDIGRYAVTVNANDVAVTGVRPRWFLASILLPAGTTIAEVESIFVDMKRGLGQVGVALVGGHTEVTDAVTRPVVVGQMLGLAEDGRFVPTGGVAPGQVVVQVGAAPVEAAAVLAAEAGALLGGADPNVLAAAANALDQPGISVVEAALLAASLGTTAMHDPTEGGLAGGLHEMARASGIRLRVDREAVLWWAPALELCRRVGADPWAALASGSLLCAFDRARADPALAGFAAAGHHAAVIGAAEEGSGVVDTEGRPIDWPERDELSRVLPVVPVLPS